MRPGPIRPGDPARGAVGTLAAAASMRPGPIRPGDRAGHGVPAAVLRASMRPGPIRPGDSESREESREKSEGFNEARADSPGRWFSAWIKSLMATGASMRPGPIRPGDEREDKIAGVRTEASMRPGPIRPGDGTSGPHGASSRRFNEARADSPGRLGLQRDVARQAIVASMRPGPIRPGDGVAGLAPMIAKLGLQ